MDTIDEPTKRRGSANLPAVMKKLPDLASKAGELVLAGIDKGVRTRWEPAKARAAKTTGPGSAQRVREVTRAFRKELGVAGAAAGGAAAVPAVTTGPAVAVGIAEISWSTVRIADLILTIAAIHGHDDASVEERRTWVLAILAFGNAAAPKLTKLAGETAKGLGKKATAKVPSAVLKAVNRALGRTIVTKYGTKRGAVALGRLLPFGIGAGLGYGFNVALVQQVARQADRFFRELPGPLLLDTA